MVTVIRKMPTGSGSVILTAAGVFSCMLTRLFSKGKNAAWLTLFFSIDFSRERQNLVVLK